MRCLLFICCQLVLCFSCVLAQEDYEDLLENDGSLSEQSELLERIEELRAHPVDINSASAVELQRVPWISPVLSHHIVHYRNESGTFRSVQHLLKVPGLDGSLLEKITPFVCVEDGSRFSSVSGRFRSRIVDGGSSEQYGGDTFLFCEKVYTRTDLNVNDRITAHLLTEKDPGESSFDDHAVYSLCFDRYNVFDQIITGHYTADFGQGLVLGGRSGASKGAAFPLSLKKRARGPKGYTSTSETGPLFGGACSGSVKGIAFSLFGSTADMDATLNDDGTVSSVYVSGLHRTDTEKEKRNVLTEHLYGAHCVCPLKDAGRVGATWYRSQYNRAFNPENIERKQYTFRGRSNSVGGFDIDVYYRHLNVFGEVAKAHRGGQGLVIGAILEVGGIEMDAIVRSYARDFYNLRNCSFAEDPEETQNESGMLLGMMYRPNRATRLRVYLDRMKNPWRQYYEKMPPAREEFWSQIEHKVTKNLQSTVRFRVKHKDVNRNFEEASKNTSRRQVNVRGQIEWKWTRAGRARGRMERVWVQYPDLSIDESGRLLFADLRLAPKRWIILDSRIMYWETDSYDSRVYEYENDLPGLMTNMALYGRGWRWYAYFKFNPGVNLRVSVKYAITHFLEDGKEDDYRFGIQCEYRLVLK